jgi:hypothetical protein
MSYTKKKEEKPFNEFMEDSLSKNKDITDIIDIRKNLENLPQNFTPTEDWWKMREQLDNLMGQIRMHDAAIRKYGLKAYEKNLKEMIPQAKELATKLQAPMKTSPKPKGGGGKLGLLLSAGLLGAGALIPKDSRAASALEKVSEAMDEADPQYQMGKAIKEGMEQSDALLEQVQKKRMLDELQKKAAEEDKIRKEKEAFLKQDITPVVELLGGKPAIKPKEAEMMTGEVPAGEEDILSVENSDRKMRNKLGYK